MLLAHQWAENYRTEPEMYERAKRELSEAVFVDCGEGDGVPLSCKRSEVMRNRGPFPKTVLQINALGAVWDGGADGIDKILVFADEKEAGIVAFKVALRMEAEQKWGTSDAVLFRREEDGLLQLSGFGEKNEYGGVAWGQETGYSDNYLTLVFDVVIAAQCIFAVMACSNVRTRDHQPDAALNKKRAKAGKVPLVSYKTLEIAVPNTRYEGGGPGGGTHASPRVHLRRGHIRKIADGKTVWVQACVVGSKHGMVLKDYKLRSAS